MTQLSISGILPEKLEPDGSAQVVEFSLDWPDSFRYFSDSDNTTMALNVFPAGEQSEAVILWLNSVSYRSDTGEAVSIPFYIYPEAEWAIFQWSDLPNLYFVASTDPEADLVALYNQHIDRFTATAST